ncbi:dihydrofolate reductase [Mycolicibacterium fortuitum]|uniref:Dihydrofolate reductase n=2 Tax=Mycolicibacterium fortuitum TaxID=1766 RepID=A0AAE5AD65_MYCFO|nr:dihydrofolate reductase [Mycolicibacterium fortuitum]MCV7140515.1 dihydrofolate reductase [Mycolicibacterium fortuitum]MDV7191412.1 dihydrofolate reductase [Mycolicibacterium fortuitum]MDV7208428.1 dihydrofolate reductase [Mycolicibacterium fortuitum]MDV7225521.1 dihydrofolate reductase [Mycolicibacterium fortuitum]MDV7258060.1 dihydrofolate reductase [Mycolicibacterium fortuitum]
MTDDLRQLAMIWAQSTSGVIGRDNGIPWHLPEDQARFKQLTVGQTVIMGRLTWESLPARVRPLPGRRNVVITRDPGYIAEGAEVLTGLDDVFRGWVIGGAQIYAQALPFAVRCEVTEIDIDLPPAAGDAMAPVLGDWWTCTTGEWLTSSAGLRYRYCSYVRAR